MIKIIPKSKKEVQSKMKKNGKIQKIKKVEILVDRFSFHVLQYH